MIYNNNNNNNNNIFLFTKNDNLQLWEFKFEYEKFDILKWNLTDVGDVMTRPVEHAAFKYTDS
jgi:hypothetical protein